MNEVSNQGDGLPLPHQARSDGPFETETGEWEVFEDSSEGRRIRDTAPALASGGK